MKRTEASVAERVASPISHICRRRVFGMLAILALSPRAAAAAAQGSRVGSVEKAAGDAFAQLTSIRQLSPAADILLGDLVWTDSLARASLKLDGGTNIHLGGKTNLKIDRFLAKNGGTLVLGDGAIVFDRADNLPKTDISVRSAFALIGVRGTRFFAGPSRGSFGVFCERGEVRIQTAGVERRLGPGDGVDIASPGAVSSEVRTWAAPRIAEAFASVMG